MVNPQAVSPGGGRGACSKRGWAKRLAPYAVWTLGHDAYVYVIADTAVAMAALAGLHVWAAMRDQDRASFWMLGGVGLSVVAAAAWASDGCPAMVGPSAACGTVSCPSDCNVLRTSRTDRVAAGRAVRKDTRWGCWFVVAARRRLRATVYALRQVGRSPRA